MKRVALVIAVVLCLAGTAGASTLSADRSADKYLLLSTMAWIDYQQSCELFYHRSGYRELNPVLGSRPAREDMLAFGLGGTALVYGIARLMPEGRLRTVLLDSVLATEQRNIEENRLLMRYPRKQRSRIMLLLRFGF